MEYVVDNSRDTQHGLQKFCSCHPENTLEKYYEVLAHFANDGMRDELADSLALAGIALCNLHIRCRLKLMQLPPEERASIPHECREVPPFLNDSRLSLINGLAMQAGLDFEVHPDVRQLAKHNGEKFLSQCYYEQLKRNSNATTIDNATGRCSCRDCSGQTIAPHTKNPCRRQQITSVARAVVRTVSRNTPTKQAVAHRQPIPVEPSDAVNQNLARQAMHMHQQQILQHSIAAAVMMLLPTPQLCPRCCCQQHQQHVLQEKRGRPPHSKGCPSRHH